MNILNKKLLRMLFIGLSLICILQTGISQAIELDLTSAKNAVGKRFASKFCEAKAEGFSSESSSEFALNNTYLKFVAFPNDEQFIEDLWSYTREKIHKECGSYITNNDEKDLKDFFKEEGEIARNRDLYLPH